MSWWGTIIGGTFGYMLGGPLGAMLGAALGHNINAGFSAKKYQRFDPGEPERVQTAFFTTTFSVMGHLAKADGRVSEHEIELARSVMAHMSLSAEQKKVAIDLFTRGRSSDFNLDEVLDQFRRECHRRSTLIQMFIEIQLHAAYADNVLHEAEKGVLLHICDRLGVSRHEFAHLEAMVRAQRDLGGAGGAGPHHPGRARDVLKEAYAVLDIPQRAGNDEVKKAYRRLMNRHHPDKLYARGMPEEMLKMATEKTQEIKAAYEAIKQARGMR